MAKKNMNPNSLANLRPPWKKGESGNFNGSSQKAKDRRSTREKVDELLKKYSGKKSLPDALSENERKTMIERILSLPVSYLKEMVNNSDNVPSEMLGICSCIKETIENGDVRTILSIYEFLYGKTQNIKADVNEHQSMIVVESPEDAMMVRDLMNDVDEL